MRSLCASLWMTVIWLVTAAMVWMIYGVLSQPVVASEGESATKSGITRPGYITSQKASQRPVTVTKGYVQGVGTSDNHIHLKTYDKGTYTLTTGRIGKQVIRVKEYKDD